MKTKSTDQGVKADALHHALRLRKMSPSELAAASGVSKATISLILSGKNHHTTALIVTKMARTLDVSADYLLGLVGEPEPRRLELGDLLVELTRVAKHLTARRQRDLLAVARAYLESSRQLEGNPQLLVSELMDVLREAGGDPEQLANLLRHYPFTPSLPPALGDDSMEDASDDDG